MHARRSDPLALEIRARLLATINGAVIVPFGVGWRVVGPGTDVLLGEFEALKPSDFAPVAAPELGRGGD